MATTLEAPYRDVLGSLLASAAQPAIWDTGGRAGRLLRVVGGIGVRHVCIVAAVVPVALAGVGCGGGVESSSERSSTSRHDGGRGSSDVEVIESHVDAMSDGDVDAAMGLRCEAGRIAREDRETFEGDLRRLIDTAGRLGVGRIEVSDTDPDLEPSLQGRGGVELTYWMTLDGEEVEEPLVSVVVDEDGERRICTFTTAEFPRMQAMLGDGLADLGQAGRSTLGEMMPGEPGADYRLHTDAWMDPATLPDELDAAIDGWARIWEREPYGGVTVSAMRFRSVHDAMSAARQWIARVDDVAVETFDVPGLPGARGVRFLAYEWLWLQPPTVGPYLDEVSLVFGDTLVTIAIGGVPTGSDFETAIAQAREVARLAGV